MNRLKSLDLLPLTFWHEFLDMVFFFLKIIHGLAAVDPAIKLFLKLASRGLPDLYLVVLLNL